MDSTIKSGADPLRGMSIVSLNLYLSRVSCHHFYSKLVARTANMRLQLVEWHYSSTLDRAVVLFFFFFSKKNLIIFN